MRLQRDKALLVVIDVQERLMPAIDNRERVELNIQRLVRGFHVLGIPALLTEQYVKGLGPTIPALKSAFEEASGYAPIEKACFSAAGCDEFFEKARSLGRKQVIVAGVETHVCVYQTVSDLLEAGYEVTIAADAVSSRSPENKTIALERMQRDGAKLSSTEMVLFELTQTSGTEEFRAISKLVR